MPGCICGFWSIPESTGPSVWPAYLERTFRQYPKDEVRRMADYVEQYNATQPIAQATEQALADVLDQPVAPRKRGRPKTVR